MIYVGVGSRETPPDILKTMKKIGKALANYGWTLRSGGAKGADTAFEEGCDLAKGLKEIYIPSDGFNGRSKYEVGVSVPAGPMLECAFALAEELHPTWASCSVYAKLLHARNGFQVMGKNLNTGADVVVCWTIDGRMAGGTGQALRIARKCKIPTVNLGQCTYDDMDLTKLLAAIVAKAHRDVEGGSNGTR